MARKVIINRTRSERDELQRQQELQQDVENFLRTKEQAKVRKLSRKRRKKSGNMKTKVTMPIYKRESIATFADIWPQV